MLETTIVALHFLYVNKLLSNKYHDYQASVKLILLLEYDAVLHLLVYLIHYSFFFRLAV